MLKIRISKGGRRLYVFGGGIEKIYDSLLSESGSQLILLCCPVKIAGETFYHSLELHLQ
jgi:hypothetical protein